ncbi:3565_t:CDS:1, partial [Acaulospora colombiana]
QRVLLFYRDAARHATLILNACVNVVELEASGDFLRRIGVSHDHLEPSDPGVGGDGDASDVPPGTGGSAGPNTPIFSTQGLEEALMRPTHLTLVPPTLNVHFRLPILSNITHLHYSATLPRNLNYQGTLLGLTHVAFDYPLGVASTKAETLVQLCRAALEWGVPSALADQDATTADEDEDELVSPATITPKLIMVVVRVLLRPRMMNSDRAAEVW